MTEKDMVDVILDTAGQKGTGKCTYIAIRSKFLEKIKHFR